METNKNVSLFSHPCAFLFRPSCWNEDASERPSFEALHAELGALFDEVKQPKVVKHPGHGKDKHGVLRKFFAKVGKVYRRGVLCLFVLSGRV